MVWQFALVLGVKMIDLDKMFKKRKVKFGIMILVGVVFLILLALMPPSEHREPLGDEPGEYRYADDRVLVNQTEKDEKFELKGAHLYYEETPIYITGIYKGDPFSVRKVIFTEENPSGTIVMMVNPYLEPGDGVIDAYISMKEGSEDMILEFYLDEDWKKEVGDMDIYWGENFTNDREFEYIEISDGVYRDRMEMKKDDFELMSVNNTWLLFSNLDPRILKEPEDFRGMYGLMVG